MRRETSEWSIRMLADFQSRINVDVEYQRAKVWSKAQKALLIDSILRGFDIPKIFLRKQTEGSPHLFDVIDGKQRLTAIWEFVSDELALLRDTESFPGLGDLGGKRWSDLPVLARDRLQFSNITVSRIDEATEDEISDLFLRLQRGEPLKAAEKRNAMLGPVRDFVANRLSQHSLWPMTGIRASRFGREEHAAIILVLVSNGGPAALKGADLHRLYEDQAFDPSGTVAINTLQLLDRLKEVASIREGFIRTRWGLVDLSISLMRLDQESRRASPESIMNFFKQFEKVRRSVSAKLSDLQTKLVDELRIDDSDDGSIPEEIDDASTIPPDMLTYHLAFAREGASEENVSTRSKIMYDRLVTFLQDKNHT